MYLGGALLSTDAEREAHVYERDYTPLSRVALPPVLDYRKDLTPIRDQGRSPMCVAYTLAAIKEYHERQELRINTNFSTKFIYDMRVTRTDGMRSSEALSILQDFGCCFEVDYPLNKDNDRASMPANVINKAANYKISSRYYIRTIEGAKQALVDHGPLMFVLRCYNGDANFWKGSGDREYHAVAIVGYDDSKGHFILRNSWGDDWADNGYGYFPYSNWDQRVEVWGLVDAPSTMPNYVPPPPAKKKKSWIEKLMRAFRCIN